MDVGIYPVSFASMVYGSQPQSIKSLAYRPNPRGRTICSSVWVWWRKIASLSGAVRTNFVNDAMIMGTHGRIHIPDFFYAKKATLYTASGTEEYGPEFEGNGYHYEAAEAMSCLREGKLESSVMPLDETLAIMHTMDTIRSQWGLKYPGENGV